MSPDEVALDTREAWRGVWVRDRSGPTRRGTTVTVGPWHVIDRLGERIETTCGKVGLRGLLWPAGGHRLEIARPLNAYGSTPPGDVCPRCRCPRDLPENEVPEPLTDDVLEDLATRVADRLLARMPK